MALLQRAVWLVSIPILYVSSFDTASDAGAFVTIRGEVKLESNSNSVGVYSSFNSTGLGHFAAIATWVKQQGGSIHEDIELRAVSGSANSTTHRIFATAAIPKGTPLMVFPESTLIMPEQEGSDEDDEEEEEEDCRRQGTARKLLRELRLGEESQYAPYIEYLLDSNAQPEDKMPTASWSVEGKEILTKLLIKDKRQKKEQEEGENKIWGMNIDLPPKHAARESMFDAFHGECDVESSDLKKDAINTFKLLHQRAWSQRDDVMIPLYDLLQHRRGMVLNTELELTESESGGVTQVVVKSRRTIEEGEELFGSYHQDEHHYGTPELFRDYGFIESYPQRFVFHETDVAFELDLYNPILAAAMNEGSRPRLVVKWLTRRPFTEDMEFMKYQLLRLVELADGFSNRDPNVPLHEWNLLVRFYRTMVTAIDEAVFAYNEDQDICVIAEGSCTEYDMLEEQPDMLNYHATTCNSAAIMKFPGYEDIESLKTPYQEVTFFRHPETTDTCFDLDGTVQICSSYREHYHTMAVNHPARYLDKIERALFVGGGDSMLLHELLKYPTLQKVVGLELDQTVTRYSFKHFGTQPHWDDDRVEWWFGDAAKSMLMLPKDYFSSFDIVVVDLSETVMSLTVTDGLDIFGALALLLKPEGIIVKNEVYVHKFQELFDFTVQTNLYDNPVVCSQLMSYGSYKNDFLKRKPVDHGINSVLMQEREDLSTDYGVWHDYRKNTTRSQDNCKNPEEAEEEPTTQTSSPGIMMIVEAEHTSAVVEDPEQLKDVLIKTIEIRGFNVLSSTIRGPASGEDNAMIAIILEEGYVVGRTWPSQNYVAFDLQLWSKTNKQDELKKSLVTTVGSAQAKSSSAYRIVSGGMFGVSEWKEDEKNRGPRLRDDCGREEVQEGVAPTDQNNVNRILKQTLELQDNQNITVAVICGDETETCDSVELVSGLESVRTTVPLWACPEIEGLDLEDETDLKPMHTCQANAIEKLQEATEGQMSVRVIVIDSKSPFAMGQILAKMLADKSAKSKLLADDVLVIATGTMQSEQDSWRRALMDRFRQHIFIDDPVFRVQAFFNTSVSSVELGLVSSGNWDFIEQFQGMVSKIESETDMLADVRTIHGGMINYQEDFDPEHFFYPSDYDQTTPLEQYMSQQPLGFQTLFQLEKKPEADVAQHGSRVEVNYEHHGLGWESGVLIKPDEEGETNLWNVRFDDGAVAKGVHPAYFRLMDRPTTTISHDKITAATASACLSLPHVQMQNYTNLGEGSLFVAFWSQGSAAILWDGREHVDINLFTYDESVEFADKFVNKFLEMIPDWGVQLRDEQPRGTGRVVNFAKDLVVDEKSDDKWEGPHWAEEPYEADEEEAEDSEEEAEDE